MTYESPPPLFLGRPAVTTIEQHHFRLGHEAIGESQIFLEAGEGLLLTSDGISQAGLGPGNPNGWTSAGVVRHVGAIPYSQRLPGTLPDLIVQEAAKRWGKRRGDDLSAVFMSCRAGRVVNIITGPPRDRSQDGIMALEFLHAGGTHIVCGATTAQIVARRLGTSPAIDHDHASLIAPPTYRVNGVDLVTEGAVTLNQTFNVLEADPEQLEPESGVTRLCELLRSADRVNVFLGAAANLGHDDIAFRQRGILPRETIVPLLCDKLRSLGKLVVLSTY